MANGTENDWDEASPALTQPRRNGPAEITSLRKATRHRLGKEHIAIAGGGVGGEHKQGSAVSYYQSSAPTTQPNGTTSLNNTTDRGRIWIDSDTGIVYYWNGTNWVEPVYPAQPPNIYQFEKLDGGASPSIPFSQGSLTNGTWIVFLEGTTINGTGSGAFTLSATINSITRTMTIDNIPDGTAPFLLVFHITVSAGTITLQALTNAQRITSMSGFLTVAS